MKAQCLFTAVIGAFLFTANEAKPKPDTIEIIQNGGNTEVVDFKPNGQEEVIDFNQSPWGGSQTSIREYSWYPNYYSGGYGGYGGGYGNGYYNNYNRGYGGYGNSYGYGNGYYNNYNRGYYGNYYGGYYG